MPNIQEFQNAIDAEVQALANYEASKAAATEMRRLCSLELLEKRNITINETVVLIHNDNGRQVRAHVVAVRGNTSPYYGHTLAWVHEITKANQPKQSTSWFLRSIQDLVLEA